MTPTARAHVCARTCADAPTRVRPRADPRPPALARAPRPPRARDAGARLR